MGTVGNLPKAYAMKLKERYKELLRNNQLETTWMSEALATNEYHFRASERVAMNHYLVNDWLALHAPDNRNEN